MVVGNVEEGIWMILQDLLRNCDYCKIAEYWYTQIWKSNPEYDLDLIKAALQEFIGMLCGLKAEPSNYVMLALQSSDEGKTGLEAELFVKDDILNKRDAFMSMLLPCSLNDCNTEELNQIARDIGECLPQSFGYDYEKWEIVLGAEVVPDNIERYGAEPFLAEALFEMAMNGFTQEDQDKKRKELEKIIQRADELMHMTREEFERHTVSAEEVFGSLGVEFDTTEEEKRQWAMDLAETRRMWLAEFQQITLQ